MHHNSRNSNQAAKDLKHCASTVDEVVVCVCVCVHICCRFLTVPWPFTSTQTGSGSRLAAWI